MSEIVFIHGIANQQTAGPKAESDWMLALAGGLEIAGFQAVADRLRVPIGVARRIDARMAYYGDLFVRPGEKMGEGDDEPLTAEQKILCEAIALEWLQNAAEQAKDPKTRSDARDELIDLGGPAPGQEQMGARALGRSTVTALCRVPGVARVGFALVSLFVNQTLRQVTKYLTDDLIRETVQERIAKLVTADTRVIVGHSLGSVAAYEAAHRLDRPLPLLLTLGSPLGLPSIVFDRLRPPPSFPSQVGRWVNVADKNDLVAAVPNLAPLFSGAMPGEAVFENWAVDNEDDPHSAEHYLVKQEVGEEMGAALA